MMPRHATSRHAMALQALDSLAWFAGVSGYQQWALAQVLSDASWTAEFIAKNQRLLEKSYDVLTGRRGCGVVCVCARARACARARSEGGRSGLRLYLSDPGCMRAGLGGRGAGFGVRRRGNGRGWQQLGQQQCCSDCVVAAGAQGCRRASAPTPSHASSSNIRMLLACPLPTAPGGFPALLQRR